MQNCISGIDFSEFRFWSFLNEFLSVSIQLSRDIPRIKINTMKELHKV